MKNLTIGALLLALFCIPSTARSATTGTSTAVVSGSSSERPLASAPVRAFPDEVSNYAAREATTPALGEFQGGGVGIYVGGGALTAVLLVVLIVILL